MKKIKVSGIETSVLFVDRKVVNGNYCVLERYDPNHREDLIFETDGQVFECAKPSFLNGVEKHYFIIRNFTYVLYYDVEMHECTLEARKIYSRFDVEKSMKKLLSRVSDGYVDINCYNCTHECTDGSYGCCMRASEYETWNGLCSYQK